MIAGAATGVLTPKPVWALYLGAIAGQLSYQVLFLKVGPLLPLGALLLPGYCLVFLIAAALAGYIRVRLKTLRASTWKRSGANEVWLITCRCRHRTMKNQQIFHTRFYRPEDVVAWGVQSGVQDESGAKSALDCDWKGAEVTRGSNGLIARSILGAAVVHDLKCFHPSHRARKYHAFLNLPWWWPESLIVL